MAKGMFWAIVGVGCLILAGLGMWEYDQRLRLGREAEWDWRTGRFAWHAGEVRLPRGYSYTVDIGGDTFAGHFTGPGGRVVIAHDIGGYAGDFATPCKSWVVDEWEVKGARAWLGTKTYWVAAPFRDSGTANFIVARGNGEAVRVLEELARSFRPIGSVTRRTIGSCGWYRSK